MKVRYSVTFEFELRPPVTHRGVVEAGQTHTCVSRATKLAQKALRPVNWTSCVCVLVERLDQPVADTVTDLTDGTVSA